MPENPPSPPGGTQKVFFITPNNGLNPMTFCASGTAAADVSQIHLDFYQVTTSGSQLISASTPYVDMGSWQQTLEFPSQTGTYMLCAYYQVPSDGEKRDSLVPDPNQGPAPCGGA